MCDVSTEHPLNGEQSLPAACIAITPSQDYDSSTSPSISLPPITTQSLPTDRQRLISDQEWECVSSRSVVGCRDSPPSTETLIDFASTILEMRLADVVRHRKHANKMKASRSHHSSLNSGDTSFRCSLNNGENIIWEEKKRRKSLDHIDSLRSCVQEWGEELEDEESDEEDQATVLLTSTCRMQVRAYVRRIASMYHDNRYHALEHAVHVTMSANKLLDMLHEDEPDREPSSPIRKKDLIASAGPCNSASDREIKCSPPTNANVSSLESSKTTAEVPDNGANNTKIQADISRRRRAPKPRTDSFRTSIVSPQASKQLDKIAKSKFSKRLRPSFSQVVYNDTFTKFCFVFAAIIHDVDHQGVPNATLVQENDPIALQYDGKSVAEKNSIKVAFRMLNEAEFGEFCSVVFGSPDDRLHMHHMVTNLVISTDIASPERMQSTKMRWEEAFSESSLPCGPLPFGRLSLAMNSPSLTQIATVSASEPKMVSIQNSRMPVYKQNESEMMSSSIFDEGRRSSIKRALELNGGQTVEYFISSSQEDSLLALRHSVVIETMINVADVAHSMQSWELFLFWNRNLFEELYDAFTCGRSEINPTIGWYENQLKFYKFYVLPLAEKMQKVGVFGDTGGRFLKNALSIRDQWDREGEQMTMDMIEAVVNSDKHHR
eukprot:scaffold215099_cov69-Cyclotella_meneghiniana.AAC.2